MATKYNPDDYTITDTLRDLYPVIKKEYTRWSWLLKKTRYRNWVWKTIDLEKQGVWSIIPLMKHSERVWWKKLFFPKTYQLINSMPIYENLMFSIYEPGTEIYPHNGWGDHFVRFHLGIECNSQCELVLEDGTYVEENGKVLMFDDSQRHYSYNRGDTTRVILLFDVIKPELEKYRKK
jgi:beta-hydroxylase